MKLTNKVFVFLLFTCSFSFGQMEQYDYKREIKSVSQQWHEIILPDEVFGKTSRNLNDLRIFGITASGDTIEAPYLLRVSAEKTSRQEVAFKTLNTAHNDKGYYFTFELPSNEPINRIQLDFKQKNFDWQTSLEGSQDQNEWFTVIEDYRIMSIKNEMTDFQFTNLVFPSSKYRFFRLLIHSKEKPELTKTSIAQHEIRDGVFKNYAVKKMHTIENKQSQQTEIDIEMQIPIRASHIKIDVLDALDYYRPVSIKYLTDSTKTEQGWIYNYSTLSSGILNSIEGNVFKFKSTTFQKLKIIIHNQDNQALTIGSITVKGYVHKLVARFTEPASYFLTYGNNKAKNANYDIDQFLDKIPKTLKVLETDNELTIDKEIQPGVEPLFKNKTWLWIIMGFIILILGWFSVKMIQKK